MTPARLAALTLALLDLQRRFFRCRGPERDSLLAECKAAESHLRRVCDEVLHPDRVTPGLFDNQAPAGPPH